MIQAQQSNSISKLQKQKVRIQAEKDAMGPTPPDPDKLDKLEEKMFDINNKILQATYD